MKDYELEMASKVWPKSNFKSEKEWLDYVNKWWPKLPGLTKTLDRFKKPKMTESKIGSYSYSCLMAELDPEDKFFVIRNLTSQLNPSDLVWGDGKGAELEPHITVLYGIHETSPRPFMELLKEISPFSVEVTGLTIFEGEQYDVLKLDIRSPELVSLNNLIRRKFEHTSSFPDYHPHCTIGYLKKGVASRYVGDTRMISSLKVSGLTFSSSSQIRGKVSIPCKDPNELVFKLLGETR